MRAHNEKRARHKGGKPLEAYDNASKAIQEEMNKPGFAGKITQAQKGSAFANCGENVFMEKSADAAKIKAVRSSDIATNTWYAGESEYDYIKGMPLKKGEVPKKLAG